MPGERYTADVAVRWSDQDAFGHVNNAVVVTLLEEARAALLFDAATRAGVTRFGAGLLVAELQIRYRRPIPWTPRGVRVSMGSRGLRAASFRVGYRLLLPTEGADGDGEGVGGDGGRDGAGGDGVGGGGGDGVGGGGGDDGAGWQEAPAVEAETQLVPYDLDAGRPRRLSAVEREFVTRYLEP